MDDLTPKMDDLTDLEERLLRVFKRAGDVQSHLSLVRAIGMENEPLKATEIIAELGKKGYLTLVSASDPRGPLYRRV